MNSLSWFLYLASLVENLQVLLHLLVVGSILLFACVQLVVVFRKDQAELHGGFGAGSDIKYHTLKWLLYPLVLAVVVVVLPSKQTMYMIAASEMGERVYQSKDVQEIKNVLVEAIKKLGK